MIRSFALLLEALPYTNVSIATIVEQVRAIIHRVRMQEEAGNPHVVINTLLWNIALSTLATCCNSGSATSTDTRSHTPNHNRADQDDENGVDAARQMVWEMISTSCSSSSTNGKKCSRPLVRPLSVQLDHISLSTAIKALSAPYTHASIGNRTMGSSSSSLQDVQRLLFQIQENDAGFGRPNQKTMTPILAALAKQGKVVDILMCLDWMETLCQTRGWDDLRPNRIHFNTLLDALPRRYENHEHFKARSENGIVSSFSFLLLSPLGIGDQALLILEKMKGLYKDFGYEEYRPDIFTFNAVLNVIAKERLHNHPETERNKSMLSHIVIDGQTDHFDCNNGVIYSVNIDISERAEALLRRMEDGHEGAIKPDVISYNTVLGAWMHSGHPRACVMAADLLRRMESNGVQPDLTTYSILIHTYARNASVQGSAENAEAVLRHLEKRYAVDGVQRLKPDLKCYNSGAWLVGFILFFIRNSPFD